MQTLKSYDVTLSDWYTLYKTDTSYITYDVMLSQTPQTHDLILSQTDTPHVTHELTRYTAKRHTQLFTLPTFLPESSAVMYPEITCGECCIGWLLMCWSEKKNQIWRYKYCSCATKGNHHTSATSVYENGVPLKQWHSSMRTLPGVTLIILLDSSI